MIDVDNDGVNIVSLKPCPNPWCESHQYGPEGAPTREDIMWLSGTENRRVGCAYCHMEGPVSKNEAEAADAWNARSIAADHIGKDAVREALAKRTSMSTVAGGGQRPCVEIWFASLSDAHSLVDAILNLSPCEQGDGK